jgi:hypothetical protein
MLIAYRTVCVTRAQLALLIVGNPEGNRKEQQDEPLKFPLIKILDWLEKPRRLDSDPSLVVSIAEMRACRGN